MSSVSEVITEKVIGVDGIPSVDPMQFTRLERMLFFAVVSECERCIRSEGMDCYESPRVVDCPFHGIREQYGISDVGLWKEAIR